MTGSGSATLTINTDTTITATNATLAVVQDYVNDTASIEVTPSAANVSLVAVSATGKSQVLNLTAEDAPVVSGIRGIDSEFISYLANDASLTTDLSADVEFIDQYGEEIAAPTLTTTSGTYRYTITEQDAAETSSTVNSTTGVITATTTAGTKGYDVTLYDDADVELDVYEVTVTVVDLEDITSFAIADLNKFYTGAVNAAYNQQVEINGVYNGHNVAVNQSMLKDVTATNGLIIEHSGAYTANVVDVDDADVTSVLSALVENTATGNTYTTTKSVVYSDAAPVATEVVAYYDDTEITAGAAQIPFAQLNHDLTDGSSLLEFVAEDQYGVNISADCYFVATNITTTGVISTAGVGSGFIAGDAGKSLILSVSNGGAYTSLKIIVE